MNQGWLRCRLAVGIVTVVVALALGAWLVGPGSALAADDSRVMQGVRPFADTESMGAYPGLLSYDSAEYNPLGQGLPIAAVRGGSQPGSAWLRTGLVLPGEPDRKEASLLALSLGGHAPPETSHRLIASWV